MATAYLRIFEAPGKGHFVVPSYGYVDDDPLVPAGLDLKFATFARRTKTIDTKEWFTTKYRSNGSVQFPRVRSEMNGPMFAHGGGTVYFISGPLFDAAQM